MTDVFLALVKMHMT